MNVVVAGEWYGLLPIQPGFKLSGTGAAASLASDKARQVGQAVRDKKQALLNSDLVADLDRVGKKFKGYVRHCVAAALCLTGSFSETRPKR